VSVLAHLADVVAELLREDDRRVLLGEDVLDGGMLGLSQKVVKDRELRARVIATPLVPTVPFAHAAGLAAAGRHPIVLLPGAGALLEGLAGLREAAAWSWRNEGAVTVPLCVIAPCGPGLGVGGGPGGDAGEAAAAMLAAVPGSLRVLCVGRAEDTGAWLRAAVELAAAEGPTVLLLPRHLLLGATEGPLPRELGRRPTAAHRVRDGGAITVLAWGAALPVVLAAVEASGVDAAVVDVGCLRPLDQATLEAEARATGRIAIVHAGPRSGGVGAELAAHLADAAILSLDAPILRVSGAEPPLRPLDEADALPRLERVVEALGRLASY
jgi:pyruvate/2-oxoglutarate/acetoin dehydrogenase E1 component